MLFSYTRCAASPVGTTADYVESQEACRTSARDYFVQGAASSIHAKLGNAIHRPGPCYVEANSMYLGDRGCTPVEVQQQADL
jgi:hypothetical protein